MKLYQFPIRRAPGRIVEEFQPIDLEYIVSISQVDSTSYSGNNIGESYASFTIYIKIGNSFEITHYSDSVLKCPQIVIDTLKQDRLDLIKAWENKDSEIISKEAPICLYCNNTGKIKTSLGGSTSCPSSSCNIRRKEKTELDKVSLKELTKNFEEIGAMHIWCKEVFITKIEQRDSEQIEKEKI